MRATSKPTTTGNGEPSAGTRHFLALPEVAAQLGVSRRTIYRRALPRPDATLGHLRGWNPETITAWAQGKALNDGREALELLTVPQVAKKAGLTKQGIYYRGLPAPDALIGTRPGWTPETITAWIQNHNNRRT